MHGTSVRAAGRTARRVVERTVPQGADRRSGRATGHGRDPGPLWRRLPDGRLHGQHGPIDLIILVSGSDAVRARCEQAAYAAFASVLTPLASELVELRRVVGECPHRLTGPIARSMHTAVQPYRAWQVTPMAAVAGAVADHVLAAMLVAGTPTRACVNNGGDMALWLEPGQTLTIGVADIEIGRGSGRPDSMVDGDGSLSEHPLPEVLVTHDSGIGGIATSGWQGRSHSLGIADAVTVVATDAASADVAATVIANACDLPDSDRVRRTPARELAPDSDLDDRLVTVGVAVLTAEERGRALTPATALAQRLVDEGRILGARLALQSTVSVVDTGLSSRRGRSCFVPGAGRNGLSGRVRAEEARA